MLWFHIRGHKLGHRFVRQSLQWGYILDFYCAALKLAIEVDGSVHDIENIGADDEQRERALNDHGIEVIRFSNEEVLCATGRIVRELQTEIAVRKQALKALTRDSFVPIDISSSSSRGKNSVEISRSKQTSKPVQRISQSTECATPGRIPATDEDIRAVNEAWRNLLAITTARSTELTGAELTTAAERAYEQKYGLTEWLKKRNESSCLVFKGLDLERKA